MEDCLTDGVDSVLVLEDDALFCKGFPLEVRHFLHAIPPDWQILFLGGEHIELEKGFPKQVNEWVYQPYNVNRMHAYAVRTKSMLQRLYSHFQAVDNWSAKHHIDFHFGEFQKRDSTGIYVPKHWLVYQADGLSDISNQDVRIRGFLGAEDIVNPTLEKQMVAVLSPGGTSSALLGGVLHKLGIPMGNFSKTINEKGACEFAENSLSSICRCLFDEPWLTEKIPFEQRVQLLKIWAASHAKTFGSDGNLLGAMNPTLCLAGPELTIAWKSPFFIAVDDSEQELVQAFSKQNPGLPIDACMSMTQHLIFQRDEFLAAGSSTFLRIRREDLVANPTNCISRICDYLHFEPTDEGLHSALRFLLDRLTSLVRKI